MNFDNEVLAYLSTRKDELMKQHDEYIADHPEIREVLNDFLSSVLLSKPVSTFETIAICPKHAHAFALSLSIRTTCSSTRKNTSTRSTRRR